MIKKVGVTNVIVFSGIIFWSIYGCNANVLDESSNNKWFIKSQSRVGTTVKREQKEGGKVKEERILYCFMNKNFEFTDERDNITDDLKEAAGYERLEDARIARDEFDEPEEWKIVKKKITYELEEIVDESIYKKE